MINQEASTGTVAILCITMQDRLPQKSRSPFMRRQFANVRIRAEADVGCFVPTAAPRTQRVQQIRGLSNQLSCNWNLTLHKGASFFVLLLSFQLSFFLWSTLSLFLFFLSAFIFASLIAHIGFSVIENAFSALRYFLLKQSTPRHVATLILQV